MSEDVTSTDSSPGRNIEYGSEAELLAEFNKYMSDPVNVETATNYLFLSLLDETILGIVFEVHHSLKRGITDAIEGQPEDSEPYSIVDRPNIEVFDSSIPKKAMECNCPNCNRPLAALKFATHLESCMGMGRNSQRLAKKRIANREDSGTFVGSTVSDDEDDVDWSNEKHKKKHQTVRTNGNKKN